MKHFGKSVVIIWVLFVVFTPAQQSFAFDFKNQSGLEQTRTGAGYAESSVQLEEKIGIIIGILISMIGLALLGLIIYGGWTWMMARGNESEVEKAQKIIRDAVIGLIVIVLAYAITQFIGTIVEQMNKK